MSIFTHRELKSFGLAIKSENFRIRTKGAEQVLREDASAVPLEKTFDIFLSHSYLDAEEVLALKVKIEGMGYSVYVDWIADKQMSRENVTATTAETLRQRMKRCDCLFFATSGNSCDSRWMPWELGYFDGIKGKVAILPIGDGVTNKYVGQEYLGLYYYVTQDRRNTDQKVVLWIHESETKFIDFDPWLRKGTLPIQR